MNELRSLLSTNQSDRLKKEKAAQDRIDDPKLPRHTVYQGDRKIQQLGQDTIENGVIINNQSVAIGDVMLPLAKGNVLRRVDNTNGGALLGTAYRDALENDFDANGDRRETELGRNGGQEPSDPNNPNKPRKPSDRVPPPFGCVPPPSQCFWSSNPIAPDGFQGYGSAVVNEEGVPLYLYCVAGTAVSPDLNCDFLRWKCVNGQCLQMSGGTYGTKQECESALRWNANVYTLGICRSGLPANNCILDGILPNTLVRTFNISNAQYPISVVIDNRIPPGYIGFNHYKFVDALGVEIDYIPASSAGYYIVYSRVCP